jgi:hypothetical protein
MEWKYVCTHALLCLCVHITDPSPECQPWTTKTSQMCPSFSIPYHFQGSIIGHKSGWQSFNELTNGLLLLTKAVGTEISHSLTSYCD